MKKIFIFIFFIEILLGMDLIVDDIQSKSPKSEDIKSGKTYFGEKLFHGKFKDSNRLIYSPNYLINIGDTISVRLWGAYEYASDLTVDTKGNIFIPKVGKIYLLGVDNQSLKSRVAIAIKKVFNHNVSIYATLNSYQPISIFVTGSVENPGIYKGLSSDSILQFVDKAGGIIDGQGSYRNIIILRNNRPVKRVDFYNFLLDGTMGLFQFQNGDVVQISTMKNSVEIDGEVSRPYIFELSTERVMVNDITKFILPKPTVTHFTVTRWSNGRESIEKHHISQMENVLVQNGDKIHFLKDYQKDNLMINIDGEHENLHTLTIQKGDSLKKLLAEIQLTSLSDEHSIQLFRKSIAKKQKQLIMANLRDLEARVLTTGSSTTEEAKIRKEESSLVLDFINRASKIEPKGQVIINESTDLADLILEDGDTIFIPKKSQIVIVEGEVSLPNAQTFVSSYTIDDYISFCGGYSPRANSEKVLLIKKNGRVLTYNASSWWETNSFAVEPGDAILVLGKVDSKNIQITSSITQILYQIAVGAAVVLRAF